MSSSAPYRAAQASATCAHTLLRDKRRDLMVSPSCWRWVVAIVCLVPLSACPDHTPPQHRLTRGDVAVPVGPTRAARSGPAHPLPPLVEVDRRLVQPQKPFGEASLKAKQDARASAALTGTTRPSVVPSVPGRTHGEDSVSGARGPTWASLAQRKGTQVTRSSVAASERLAEFSAAADHKAHDRGAQPPPPVTEDTEGRRLRIISAGVGTGVVSRMLREQHDVFAADVGELWAWIRIDNPGPALQVTMVWRYRGERRSRVFLDVGTSSGWRTWSRCRINSVELGPWQVDVLDPAGRLLGKLPFTVVDGTGRVP